jgi:hypothetical protein
MVPIFAGLPALLLAMRNLTVDWIWYDKSQIIQVETGFTQITAQIWPVRRRLISFSGKSSKVLKHVLAKLAGRIIESPLKP